MIRYLGALAKDRDSVAAMLIYGFAGRLIYGFAIFHNGITTANCSRSAQNEAMLEQEPLGSP